MQSLVGNVLQVIGGCLILEGLWRIFAWWAWDRFDGDDGPGRFSN